MAAIIPDVSRLNPTLPSARTQPAAPRGLPNIDFANLPNAPRVSYNPPRTAEINARERQRNLRYQEQIFRFEQEGRQQILRGLQVFAENRMRMDDQRQRQQLTSANTEMKLYAMDAMSQFQDRQDYENFESEYSEAFNNKINEISETFTNPAALEAFTGEAKLTMKAGILDVRKMARGVEVDVKNAGMMQQLQKIGDYAIGSGDLEGALDLMEQNVESAYWISETDQFDMKREQTGAIIKASLDAAEENPAEQLRRLNTLGETGKELLGENTFEEMKESATHHLKMDSISNQVTKWETEDIPYEDQLLEAMEIKNEELRNATVKEIEWRKVKRDNADNAWRSEQYNEISLRLDNEHPELPPIRKLDDIPRSVWRELTPGQRDSLEAKFNRLYPGPSQEGKAMMRKMASAPVENQLEEMKRQYHSNPADKSILDRMSIFRQENEEALIRSGVNRHWSREITALMKPDTADTKGKSAFTLNQKLSEVTRAMGLSDEERGMLAQQADRYFELHVMLNNREPTDQEMSNRIDDLILTNYTGFDSYVFEDEEGEVSADRFEWIMRTDPEGFNQAIQYFESKGQSLSSQAERIDAYMRFNRDRAARGY